MSELDIHLFRVLHHAFSGWWIVPMAVLSAIGGGWGSLAVLPMLYARRTRPVAVSLAAVLAVTAISVFVLKRLLGRVRPCGALADVKALVFDPPSDCSFPSGHAAGSFAFCVFLAIVVMKASREAAPRRGLFAAGALILLAGGVGLSRVALGVHFPGDVLAGALLGSTLAVLGARRHHAAAPSEADAQ